MKNTLKRTLAALGATALTASMATMTAFAASGPMPNYCDKQDNEEAIYDGSYWVQPNHWNEDSAIDPSEYGKTGAEVHIQKKEIDIKEAAGSTQEILISYDGPDEVVSTVAFHILWDTRMEVVKYKGDQVSNANDALEGFATVVTEIEPGLVHVASSAGGNKLYAGDMYRMQFKLPEATEDPEDPEKPVMKVGDIYPVGIRYQYDGKTGDLFYDASQTHNGRLHMAYIFTQGIENGYIKITTDEPPVTSTTTVTDTTTTTETTTTTVTDTTTTSSSTDTTTTKPTTTTSKTTPKPGTTTTTSKTTQKPGTGTTTKKSDSPQTGVGGVGVAAAGLAIAVGTAFALRKKED